MKLELKFWLSVLAIKIAVICIAILVILFLAWRKGYWLS